jgi:hypothetical protein
VTRRDRKTAQRPNPSKASTLLDPSAPIPIASRILLGLVFAVLALLACRQVGSLDIGFHLKAGEHLLAGGGWPRNDPFTYTLSDHRYLDTSWGYQVIVATVQRAAGAPGIVALHLLAALSVFGLVCRTARLRAIDPLSLPATLLLGVVASEMRFEARPEVFSWLLLAVVLHLLERDAVGLRSPLWLLAPLHLLWANLHGLFVLGWIAIGCYGLGAAIAAATGQEGERARVRRLVGWGSAAVAATVVNPYGLRGTLFPLTLATRLGEGNVFAQSIGEFASPFDLRLSEHFPFFPRLPLAAFWVLAASAVIAALVHLRRRRFDAAFLAPPFLVLSGLMIRNLPLLAVACLPAIAQAIPASGFLSGLGVRGPRQSRVLRGVTVVIAIVTVLLGARTVTDAYYLGSRRPERFGWGWNRQALPIEAAEHALRVGLPEHVLNHLNFGGYLMWALPQPVFIDGRLEVVGESFFEEYRRTLASEEGIEAAVARFGVRWIVFPYATNPELLTRLSRDPRWRLAHVDPVAVIFVRESPDAARFVGPSALSSGPPEAPEVGSLPGLDRGTRRRGKVARWLAGLYERQVFPDQEHYLGLFHLFRGEPAVAAAWFAAGIARSKGAYYEMYQNLGAALFRLGRLDEARTCYRIVLGEDPDNRVARERLRGMALPAARP